MSAGEVTKMGIFDETVEYLKREKYNAVVIKSKDGYALGKKYREIPVFMRSNEFVVARNGDLVFLTESKMKELMRDHKWQKKELSDINTSVPWDGLEDLRLAGYLNQNPFIEGTGAEGVRWVCKECKAHGIEESEHEARVEVDEHVERHEDDTAAGIVEADVEKVLPQVADSMNPEDDDFIEKAVAIFSDVDLSEGVY